MTKPRKEAQDWKLRENLIKKIDDKFGEQYNIWFLIFASLRSNNIKIYIILPRFIPIVFANFSFLLVSVPCFEMIGKLFFNLLEFAIKTMVFFNFRRWFVTIETYLTTKLMIFMRSPFLLDHFQTMPTILVLWHTLAFPAYLLFWFNHLHW